MHACKWLRKQLNRPGARGCGMVLVEAWSSVPSSVKIDGGWISEKVGLTDPSWDRKDTDHCQKIVPFSSLCYICHRKIPVHNISLHNNGCLASSSAK